MYWFCISWLKTHRSRSKSINIFSHNNWIFGISETYIRSCDSSFHAPMLFLWIENYKIFLEPIPNRVCHTQILRQTKLWHGKQSRRPIEHFVFFVSLLRNQNANDKRALNKTKMYIDQKLYYGHIILQYVCCVFLFLWNEYWFQVSNCFYPNFRISARQIPPSIVLWLISNCCFKIVMKNTNK